MTTNLLTKEMILSASDIRTKEVEVPEWGGSVLIRQLTRSEQDDLMKRQLGSTRIRQDRSRTQDISGMSLYGHDAFICLMGLCAEDGSRLFSEKDLPGLEKKNGEVVGRLAKEILSFSGMNEDVELTEKLKNSQGTQTGSSTTG